MADYILSAHAQFVLKERSIPVEWLERVLQSPEKSESDEKDAQLMHALGRISEHDNRVLRVVYNPTVTPVTVVTVYFDRAMRNTL